MSSIGFRLRPDMSDYEPIAQRSVEPSREFAVGSYRLQIFDGLLPDVTDYVKALSVAAFTRTEVARSETAGYKHWVTPIALQALRQQPILQTTVLAVESFAGRKATYVPYRAYTNVASYGDMLFTHTDCLLDQHDLTALWYVCDRWDIEWGGETLFFDAAQEIACAVRPKPGRLVIFDGNITHVGRPPNRICYQPRYTLAIKFQRSDVDGR